MGAGGWFRGHPHGMGTGVGMGVRHYPVYHPALNMY